MTILTTVEEASVLAFRQHTLLSLAFKLKANNSGIVWCAECLDALQLSILHLTRSSVHRGL